MQAASHAGIPAVSNPKAVALLTIGAIGVVFGDIGTSPLYAFREAFGQAAADGASIEEILGVLSLALWSLIIVVTIKYISFLMRADNDGEGGVLALMALAGRGLGKRAGIVLVLGAIGATLFYGDAILTPALSVLSAVEGLRTIPGNEDISQGVVHAITVAILIGLFAIQSRGTATVSKLFGPICVVWFLSIGALGLYHIGDDPGVLAAIIPTHAIWFMANHGVVGLFVLGAVFLTVTGAEALTADMGHFGRFPIRLGWFLLVFPALTLNYLGQGAFAMATLTAAEAAGTTFDGKTDWFFLMAPENLRVGLVIIAGLATIIASQAVITGAFSLTQQAVQLGLLPRMRIRQTSADQIGQIYLPVVNWLLLIGVLIFVFGFGTSSAMAAAYGIAVTGTMVVTTCLAFFVVRHLWKWSLPKSLLVIIPFLVIDMIFFGANILRVIEGGWVPLVLAGALGTIVWIWVRGKALIQAHQHDEGIAFADLVKPLTARPPHRVAGTAVFLTSDPDIAPPALLHNIKHNKILHERNIIATVKTASIPHVAPEDRVTSERIDENFERVTLRYGFMEQPDIPRDMALDCSGKGSVDNPMKVSFFIGRNTLRASAAEGLPLWQDHILLFLQRNASDPTDFFNIPANRVVELGVQVTV
jgi:KUP system potassium uptake protein